jgi:pimeloyl-ACP methyl ester carboxylesterase
VAKFQNPAIVIPGVAGTSLFDEYPMKSEALWTAVLNKEYQRLAMHPDDHRYEAFEPALVRPHRLLDLGYDDLVVSLRHDLSVRADQPTPVFAFPYDWRQDVAVSGAQLAAFVEEVVARTKLLRHYSGFAQNPKVDLVGHSMGGLVICEYLSQLPNKKLVGKVATLGTPFLGSLESLVKLLTGLGNLSGEVPKEREREAARSMPAIYQLLPSFPRAIKEGAPKPPTTNLFRADAWQSGVLQSLAEYIRLHAVDVGNRATRKARAEGLLQWYLDLAREHRRRVESLDLKKAGLSPSDWLAVVGVGAKTRVQATLALAEGAPRYQIADPVGEWSGNGQPPDTGDSTVPLAGAMPPFLDPAQVVAVTTGNFGFWELKDRALTVAAGFHAMLPNLNLVQRLVLRHLRSDYRGEVWGMPVPGVAANAWNPPIPKLPAKAWDAN